MDFRRIFTLFILLSLPPCSFGQLSMEAFLATARDDISLAPTQNKLDYLKDNKFNGPWISRVEFRTRSNNADFSQEDFRLRLTPGNPGELKGYKRYYKKQLDLLQLEYLDRLNSALIDRYEVMIDHIFETKKKNNLEKQLEVNNQLLKMMGENPGLYKLDIGDLIDAESTELDLGIAIEEAKSRLDEIDYMVRDIYEYKGDINWPEEEIMGVDDILNLFEEFKGKPTGEHINLVKQKQRNKLEAERFRIEKSESLRNIGYFQAEYDTDRGNEPSRHFGYQIGIRIPIVNPDKPDLHRRELNLMDDEALLAERKDEYRRKMELAVLRMSHLAGQYKLITKKLEETNDKNFLSLQRSDKSLRMRDLIKLNEFYIELIDKQNSIAKKIFETYIEYLDLSGKLTEMPLRNYLSKNFTEF